MTATIVTRDSVRQRSDQARVAIAYDNWATSVQLHDDARRAWRHYSRLRGDDFALTQKWLAAATSFALTMTAAKAQYQAAKAIALEPVA